MTRILDRILPKLFWWHVHRVIAQKKMLGRGNPLLDSNMKILRSEFYGSLDAALTRIENAFEQGEPNGH